MTDLGDELIDVGFVCLAADTGLKAVRELLGRQGPTQTLIARDESESEPWSLSGVHGRRSFPWHTDGAVSTRPPRWVLLTALKLDRPTSTELLRPDDATLTAMQRTVLTVTTRTGVRRYLPACLPEPYGYRLRWDSRVCQPKFGLSTASIDEQPPTAVIDWKVGHSLLFDNARLLHRRPDVTDHGERILERTYFGGT